MGADARVSVDIDQEAGAAYVRLSNRPISMTEQFNDDIAVDLDEHGTVVGIEVLDLATSVPLDELVTRFHIKSNELEVLLQAIRPSTTVHSQGTSSDVATFGALRQQDRTLASSC